MSSNDPKKDQSKATGNAQNNAYPLDRFTVSTKNSGSNVDNKSPYFKSDAPSINLPKGGGAIKGIDEKFTINASNGTASLSIPLPITPGRSGFNPNLALQYNSGSGNSEFGLGWGIGVMSVQRKTDKKLPQYDDASESDVFLLAGAEDLLPKCDQDVSTWLPDIETVDGYVIKRYRPRIEGLFAKIECIRNVDNLQSWWKVTTKDNVVTFYGLSPEARIADPANELRVYKWLAQLSYDNKGNVMQYFYITDNDPETIPAAIHERNRKNGLSEWTNTYVKSIAYCNINSFTPSNEYQPTLTQKAEGGIETELFNAGYQMQLVFDYGNHNPSQPVPYDALTGMTVRKDPFSDFKAGFEIRTYRKCKRVLMYHYFTELLDESSYLLLSAPNIPSCLVSSLDLSYHHDDSEDSFVEVDMLQHVTPKGYKRNTGGTYRVKSKPQISIGYNGVIFRTELNSVSEGDVKNAPQGLTGQYHWIDLYGEGLQGILSEHGGSWYYKQNLGYGNFGSAVQVAPKPSVTGLGGEWQWQDLDGDGSRQLVSRSNILPGYFEFNDDQHWQTFKTFKKNINVDWNSPFTRLLDLDGDGRADVLISEDNIWRWYKNNGRDGIIEGGFSSVSFDEERAPRLLHNDKSQAIFLADMNGDGLTDIVRVRNGEVCYWPNIGYGKFGARVVMGNVPHFDTPDAFNAQSITIADVTATGAPDIVYIKPGKCTIWANLSGNVLGAGKDVYLPHMDQYTKIAVGDFLGKGTGCIVWSTQLPGQAASPLRYIDLFFGQKPYLINRIEQDLVKSISIQYKSSTYFYLEDRKAGKPWATRLPFPVHCVQEVITNDLVSSAKLVSTYSYHHGYYDHAEKEFRGFGRVDMLDAESAEGYNASSMALTYLNQPPVLTKTWYHTGAWMRNGTLLEAFANEYYPLDWAELATSPDITAASESQEIREAYRALKGQPLRQEIYAIDGTEQEGIPYTVTTNAYSVERIQPVLNNRFASFYSYKRETLTFSCERNENDPRVLHDLVLGLDKYGNILRSAKVAYPRRASAITAALADEDSPMPEYAGDVQARMLITYAETDYTNDTLSTAYRLRLPYQARNYELTGATPAGDVWTVSELITQIDHPSSAFISFTDTPTTGIQKRLVAHSRTTYLDDVCNALPLGTLGNIDLVHQKYTLVFDEGTVSGGSYYNDLVNDTILAEAGYVREDTITEFGSSVTTNFWLPGGRVYYMPASFYLPSSYIDPWGNITTITYWDAGTAYQLLPNTVTDELGNVTTANEYDWRCLQPSKITDINNNQSHVIYDTLCIPVAVAVMDKDGSTIGDTLLDLDPDSDDDLDLQDTFFSNPYSVAQDLLKGASWRCLYRWAKLEDTYRVSRIAMIAREQHNTDDPDSPLMIRITYADGFGRVAMEKILAAPEEGETTLRWITSGKTVYNNKGKAVMQYEPFFDTTHEFNTTYQAEEAGVTPRMYYDPLGRLFRTELPDGSYTKTEWTPWKNEIWDNNDTAADSDWYAAASLSTDTNLNDAATKTNDHIATPTVIYLDTLARPVCTIQHNRIDPEWDDEFYISHTVLDIQGNRLEIHDARELLTHSYKYNMLQAVVKQQSIDSGSQVVLCDVAGQPLYSWDADNREFHFTYDDLRRVVSKEVTVSATTTVLELMEYGEGATDEYTNNLRGKPIKIYDGAGTVEMPLYDFKGAPLQTVRTYVEDYTNHPDWTTPGSVTMETETYTTATTYDALGRPITITTPDGGTTTYAYNQTGLLFSVSVADVGSLGATPVTTDIINEIYYNAKSQREKVKYENGTTTTYEYDPNTFRITRILTLRNSDSEKMQDLKYWYDPVGNITYYIDEAQDTLYFANTVSSSSGNYTYDALYRLIICSGREHAGGNNSITASDSVRTFGGVPYTNASGAVRNYTQYYTYDKVGNMTQMKHTTTGGTGNWTRDFTTSTTSNRLTGTSIGSNGSGTETYTYDNRGNIISGFNHLSSLEYNEENRLQSVTDAAGIITYYQYDSAGQRVRKMTDVSIIIRRERKYIGGWELYRQIDPGTGTISLARETLHVMDDASRVAIIDSNAIDSLVRYQYTNHLGTATLEVNEDTEVITYEEYYPYGNTAFTTTQNVMTTKRYRYIGKERDDESGFYYMGARYYCPWLARWLAPDPINGEWYNMTHGNPTRNTERQFVELTASSYEYCYANPVRFTDPSGEQPPIWGDNPLTREVQGLESAANQAITDLKEKSKEALDNTATAALKSAAYYYSPELLLNDIFGEEMSEGRKQEIFDTDYKASVGVLLYEFATGTGPAHRDFYYDKSKPNSFANAVVGGYVLEDIVEGTYDRVAAEKIDNNKDWNTVKNQNRFYGFPIEFSPDQTGARIDKSIYRHNASNSAQFFMGGASARVFPIGDASAKVEINNSTSRSSLFLHLAENNSYGKLRTTSQTIHLNIVNLNPAKTVNFAPNAIDKILNSAKWLKHFD